MGPFVSQNTVSMTLFTDCCSRNLFFTVKSVFFRSIVCNYEPESSKQIVREFVLQSHYYVHFRAKYPWERYEPPYPPSYGLNSTTTVLLGEWLRH